MSNPVIVQNSRFSGPITLRAAGTGSGAAWPAQCNAVATEVVQAMALIKAAWSVSNGGFYTVKRGGNTVLILSGSGQIEFDKAGTQLEKGGELSSNVVITLTRSAAAESSLVLKFHKRSDGAQYS